MVWREFSLSICCKLSDNLFHRSCAALAKAQSPYDALFVLGMFRWLRVVALRFRVYCFTSKRSDRYFGVILCCVFQANNSILNYILALIGSQWRFFFIAVILSYLQTFATTRPAAFCTNCNLLIKILGRTYNSEFP